MKKRKFETGASYYPERWEAERWEVDAKLMQQMGIQFIRTGEFAWSEMEPREGFYEFDWLENAINVFGKHGIHTILCTPTAAPPPWLTHQHPDVLPLTQEGKPFLPGQRRHYCFNSPTYAAYAQKIVREMATRFANNQHVIAWQIDNELGGEEFICCCDRCRSAFIHWLQEKYKTIDQLNLAWGCVFFSFMFRDFFEVNVPMGHNLRFFNPGMRKDYLAFYSDSMKRFMITQYDVIKRYTDQPVTTNRFDLFWGSPFDPLMDRALDIVSFDSYYLKQDYAAFHNDFFRGVNRGKPYWILEQNCEVPDFSENQSTAALQTIQAFLKGAERLAYFSWRQVGYGCEQDACGGVIAQNGLPNDVYAMLQQTRQFCDRQQEFWSDLSLDKQVAILYSNESRLLYQTSVAFSHIHYDEEFVNHYYIPLCRLGINVDIIFEPDDIQRYAAVIVPLHMVYDANLANALLQYAAQGGRVLITGDFMLKEPSNQRVKADAEDWFRTLSGVSRENILFMHPQGSGSSQENNRKAHGFIAKVRTGQEDARIVQWLSRPGEQKAWPLSARNHIGKGVVHVQLSLPDAQSMKELAIDILHDVKQDIVLLPDGVEMIRMTSVSNQKKYCALFNKTDQHLTVQLFSAQNVIVEANSYTLWEDDNLTQLIHSFKCNET